jgi:Transglycosylase SLT domain
MEHGMARRLATFAAAAAVSMLLVHDASAAKRSGTGGLAATYQPSGPTGGVAAGWEPSGPTGGVAPGGVSTPAESPAPPAQPPAPTPPPARPGDGAGDIPREYLRLYRAAARRYGLDWRVLAAIGKNESDHGRSTAPGVTSGRNFADCCSGPMQICTVKACGRVWQYYATDGNGDGDRSVYDPADAIFAAGQIVRDLQRTFGRRKPAYLLAGYNAGPGAVQRAGGVPDYPETRAYVANGRRYMRQIRR